MDLGGFLGVCPVEEPLTLFEAMAYTQSVSHRSSCRRAESGLDLERARAPCGPDPPRGDIM